MSVLRAFNIGVSGLGSTGQAVGVIGDNIANASTTGFKTSRADFQDILATSLKGIDGGDQLGAGTQLGHIKTIMSQGDIARTENLTDLAINGDGFFTIKAPFGMGYSRDGTLHFNKDGELVSADEYPVMGFTANADGKITSQMDSIKVDSIAIPAEATSEVSLLLNLDTRDKIFQFDPQDIEETSNYSHSISVYDNVGTVRLITLAYNKISPNNWQYRAFVDGKDAVSGQEGELTQMASGRLVFNDKGRLQEEVEESNAFLFNQGAAQQKITFNFGESITEGGTGLNASTQYGSETQVARTTQDGFEAGNLSSLTFDSEGTLVAVYTNGVSKMLGRVAIAKFENNEGLSKVGKNLFKESKKSGQPVMGEAGTWGRGEILSKALELSNVDIAQEFVNLMTTQRNFSANAKAVTTADQMLQEVLNIKRT